MVEFALVLPIFMALVLGIFSGGSLYNQKLTLTNAAREATRYGATLPVTDELSMNAWLDSVAAVAVDAATGELAAGTAGRVICIAYIHPAGSLAHDRSTKRVQTASGTTYSSGAGERCFSDSRPDDERRIQVRVQREGRLDALVFATDLTLSASSVARFEATPVA